MFKNAWNIASIKSVALFYLKYKAELDQGHVLVSEMEVFATNAAVPIGSALDRGLRYTSDGCYNIFWKPNGITINW